MELRERVAKAIWESRRAVGVRQFPPWTAVDFETRHSFLDMADAAIAAMGPKWISVDERLPYPGEWVLVTIGAVVQHQTWRIAEDYRLGGVTVWETNNGWDEGEEIDPCDPPNITHWMPLPKPLGGE